MYLRGVRVRVGDDEPPLWEYDTVSRLVVVSAN